MNYGYGCQCLYEIENGLPRTQHCFMPCEAQRQILAREEKFPAIKDISELVQELEALKKQNRSLKIYVEGLWADGKISDDEWDEFCGKH